MVLFLRIMVNFFVYYMLMWFNCSLWRLQVSDT